MGSNRKPERNPNKHPLHQIIMDANDVNVIGKIIADMVIQDMPESFCFKYHPDDRSILSWRCIERITQQACQESARKACQLTIAHYEAEHRRRLSGGAN